MLLSPEQHAKTVQVVQDWAKQRFGRGVGVKIDWTKVSAQEAQELTQKMFEAADVPEDSIRAYIRAFHSYIYR